MTPEEKTEALRAVGAQLVGQSYEHGAVRITFTQPPQVDDHGRLVVWVEATRDGTPLVLDLPFIYVNPPLGVIVGYDPQFRIQRHGKGGDQGGHLPIVENRPIDALKQIVADTVDQS